MSLIKKIRPYEIIIIIFSLILLILRKIAGTQIVSLSDLFSIILLSAYTILAYALSTISIILILWYLHILKNWSYQQTVEHDTYTFKVIIEKFLYFFRDYSPLILLFVLYETLSLGGDLVHKISPTDMDGLLIALDQNLFGVQASVWSQQFIHPWLTEIMSFAYSLHYLFPLLVAIILYWNKKGIQFENYMLGIVLLTCTGLLLYFVVPGVGPEYTLNFEYDLQGSLMYNLTEQSIDLFESTTRDAFPSLHVGLSTIVLLFAYRYNRKLFWIILPFVLLNWASTIYLRKHYLIDVPAGWILAIICYYASIRINTWWYNNITSNKNHSS